MNIRAAIESALSEAKIDVEVRGLRPLPGGCIHQATRIDLADGRTLVAKIARGAATQFEEESHGLVALHATGTVVVPQPIVVHATGDLAVLLMSFVETAPPSSEGWRRLGRDLAALHGADVGERYGFDIDNHLGSTPQPNGWMDDWVEFNRVRRFGHQIDLARSRGLLIKRELELLRRCVEHLSDLIPSKPKPALLHGDLWSGNALPTVGGRIALIDPAPSIGDGWADIAMMKLFGGFPSACFDAYSAAIDDDDAVETRIAVYQLYHVLNHLNLFGRGYAGQALDLARGLL